MHVRYENLKHVVLNELLAEHDHAELDAQLDEAAWRSALFKGTHIYSASKDVDRLTKRGKGKLPPPCGSLQKRKHNRRAAQQTCERRQQSRGMRTHKFEESQERFCERHTHTHTFP